MPKRRTNPKPETTADDRIKAVADTYLAKCFPHRKLSPDQEIEIRLAIYAGMIGMFGELMRIVESPKSDAEMMIAFGALERSIADRALTLNKQRQQR